MLTLVYLIILEAAMTNVPIKSVSKRDTLTRLKA